jgi:uncharacterized protein DUF3313
MLRYVWIAGLLLAAPAFAVDAPQALNGLERVPNAKVALAYVKPGLDWSKYKTIQLLPLSIPATARDTAPKGTRPDFGQTYILSDKYVAALQKAYDEVTRDELAKGGLHFVSVPQADTLVIAAQINNIQLNAPVDDVTRGPRSATFTKGAGAMTLAAAFGDGMTGQVVAMAEDRKVSTDANIWRMNTDTGNLVEARRAFRQWASLMRERLSHP